jgi:hypothetical protein
MPTHTGIGPYFYADGFAAAPAWAKPVAPGGASQTTMGATLKVKKLATRSEYRSVRPGGAGPGYTTQHQTPNGQFTTIVGTTTSYPATTIFPEVVTMSLVSPAIMTVGTGMALIGFVNVNLQRVPEPGPMILMGVSALCLAGISLARGRKN